jgi:HSP20 family molecular chaperone IbpA
MILGANMKKYKKLISHNLVELKDSYIIQIDLSRFNKNEISITAFEKKLTVSAKKRIIILDDLEEIKFQESFYFDCSIEVLQIYANFYKGFLEIYLPKLANPHQIKIFENESNRNEINYEDEWPLVSLIPI